MLKRLTGRYPLLPAFVLLLSALILLLIAVRLSTTVLPVFTPPPTLVVRVSPVTPAPPTSTPTSTPTVTRTPRPTWTLAPTSTPTQTATPTRTPTPTHLPTLTQASPLRFNDLYLLREWDADSAAYLAALLQGYPDALFPRVEDRRSRAYEQAFDYPALALQEALIRFPDHYLVDPWRWNLAYNLAHLNDPRVGVVYATLITSALQNQETTLAGLADYFTFREPRLELVLYPLPTRPGALSNNLVLVRARQDPADRTSPSAGGAYLWIIETPNGFQTHLLAAQFDFANQIEPFFLTGDATGDGEPEVLIYFSPSPADTSPPGARLFDLADVPPRELAFPPEAPFVLGTEYEVSWSLDPELTQTVTAFPSCPVRLTKTYAWTGAQLSLEKRSITLEPDADLLAYCDPVIRHADVAWGPEITRQLIEPLLPGWPPAEDLEGRPYPPEGRDELRYRYALQLALSGEQEQAQAALEEIISSPTTPTSRWMERARQFLQADTSELDLYPACVAEELCDPRQALRHLIAAIPLEQYAQVTTLLADAGVQLRSSGLFDFEADGDPERWILVQHRPIQKLELWLMVKTPAGITALFADISESSEPALRYHEPIEDPPIVQLRLKEGFRLYRVEGTGEPYLVYIEVAFIPTTFTRDALDSAMNRLFEGEDPRAVAYFLDQVQEDDHFNCTNYQICDRFFYILGLSYELAGRDREAVDAYLELWRSYPRSPFTIMARLKLQQKAVSTPRVTPTFTRTATPAGPTPTGSTPTASPPTATPSTPYPDPNPYP